MRKRERRQSHGASPRALVIVTAGPHLETPAKQLIFLEANSASFSKRSLESLNNRADFDSTILQFAQGDVGAELLDLALYSAAHWKLDIWKGAALPAAST